MTFFFKSIFPGRILLVLSYRALVFFKTLRKMMGSIIFRDEIEIGDRSGVEGSSDGFLSRIADGSWREPGKKVGMIWRRSEQMFFGQIAIKILDSIDDGGVTL